MWNAIGNGRIRTTREYISSGKYVLEPSLFRNKLLILQVTSIAVLLLICTRIRLTLNKQTMATTHV